MNIYYNKEGIGDVLLIELKQSEKHQFQTKQEKNVVKILDKNDQVIGFNLFQASEYGLQVDTNGPVELTPQFIDQIQRIISEAGFSDQIDVDLSPTFVVGCVTATEAHPNADRLKVCTVEVGDDQPLRIVCGAPNIGENQKVVIAKVGAIMPSGMVIKEANLRGVDSYGMVCAARELNLKNAPEEKGILVLPDAYEVGSEFVFEGKDYKDFV